MPVKPLGKKAPTPLPRVYVLTSCEKRFVSALERFVSALDFLSSCDLCSLQFQQAGSVLRLKPVSSKTIEAGKSCSNTTGQHATSRTPGFSTGRQGLTGEDSVENGGGCTLQTCIIYCHTCETNESINLGINPAHPMVQGWTGMCM